MGALKCCVVKFMPWWNKLVSLFNIKLFRYYLQIRLGVKKKVMKVQAGNTKGGSTIDLLFDWFGISCMTTGKFYFYLQNRLFQTSQTGGQWYSDTSPFSIP